MPGTPPSPTGPATTCVGALTALAERGYFTARTETVIITGEGERAIAALWTIQERVDDGPYLGFSPDERARLEDLLTRLQNNAVRLTVGGVSQDA